MSIELRAIRQIESTTRIPELDGLRGVAVLLIIYYHYFQQQVAAEPGSLLAFLKSFWAFSWSGIDLFLVLSGFLIGGILFDARESTHYFRRFYLRRACRILPPYVLFCLLFFVSTHVFTSDAFIGLRLPNNEPIPWHVYATFTQNFWIASHATWAPFWLTITWSLAVEEQFYLVAPFIIRRVKRLVFGLIALITVAPILRILAYLIYQTDIAPYVLSPCRADALALGVLAAVLVRRARFEHWLRNHPKHLSMAFWMLLAGVIIFATRDPHHRSVMMMTIGYSWLSCFYVCALLIAVSQPNNPLSRVLRFSALRWVGSIAYGSYLLHQAMNGICHGLIFDAPPSVADFSGFLVTLLAVTLTLLLANLSWRYFEKPFVEFGHHYSYRK